MAASERHPSCWAHTPCPRGYIAWHEWAEMKSRTHRQVRCPGCALWKIWVPKVTREGSDDGGGE